MADFTNYGALATIEWVLAQTPAAPPANLYVQLHTGDPGPDALLNVAANSERKLISFAQATNIDTDGHSQAVSDAAVSWPVVPATETYSYISLWDALTSGNPWYFDAMVAPVPVTSGGAFVFPTGQTVDHV
ncbi:unnamed protein product [marine sediment metagenome]|uniref:Uncharacterized protein n=1 Tax=marine sediment metagenome TaxID=412755 RepID=X0S6R6_9ZZZZ